MSIDGYPSVVRWLNNLRQSSAETYLHYLKRFCDYAKLNPDQLVEAAKKDSTAVHDTLKAFRRQLENTNNSSNTCQIAYMAGRSFLKWNDVKLSQMPRSYKGRVRYESGRLIEPYEVAKMISFAKNVRDKAIVSFIYQSGQRVGVLTALRYRHVSSELEKGKNPVVVEVEGELVNKKGFNVNKASAPYRFAIGKECADLLQQMMLERKEAGEPIDNDTWLFRNYSERLKVGFRRMSASERGSPLTPELISDMVKKAATRAGIQVKRDIGKMVNGTPKTKFEVHSHAFRRSWKDRMRKGGVADADLLNFMMGHELPYGGAYDKFPRETVRAEYSKAEPSLTVMVSPDVSAQIELKELEQKHAPVLQALPQETRVKYDTKSPRERVQFLKSIPAQMKPNTSKSKPKKGQRMIIDASEIGNHCNHGWRAVFQFQDGRVQVEYDREET